MTYTEVKFFASWDYELEELWLNHMASLGWHLQKVTAGTIFTFEKGEPAAYQYRLEMVDNENREDYLQFMEEAGIEKIGGYLYWVYFRKKNDGSSFDLFSDSKSKVKHLNRIYRLMNVTRILLTVLLVVDYGLICFEMWASIPGASASFFAMIPCVLICLWLWLGCRKLKWKISDLENEQVIYE